MIRKMALGALALSLLSLPAGCKSSPSGSQASSGTNLSDTAPLLDDNTESSALQNEISQDADFENLTSAAPLINDGGAVFLDSSAQTQSLPAGGQTVQSLIMAVTGLQSARIRRFGVHRVEGPRKVEIACGDPAALDPMDPGGYLNLCFHHADSTATVIMGNHEQGTFGIDLPPYDYAFDHATSSIPATGSFGLKTMDLLFDTHATFRKTRGGWKLDGVSPVRQLLARTDATHDIRIAWLDIQAGGKTLLKVTDPAAILPRTQLPPIPRGTAVLVRAQITGGAAVVTVQAPDGTTLRLLGDGAGASGVPSDGIYSVAYRTPANAKPVHKIAVQAIADPTLESETKDNYDASAWIVPVQIQ